LLTNVIDQIAGTRVSKNAGVTCWQIDIHIKFFALSQAYTDIWVKQQRRNYYKILWYANHYCDRI